MPRSSTKSVQPHRPSVAPITVAPPSLGDTLKHSVVMGIGSSIGHRIVGTVLGPVSHTVASCPELPSLRERLTTCLKEGGACNGEVNAIERCLKGQS